MHMKKVIIIIFITLLFCVGIYNLFAFLDYHSQLSSKEKYSLKEEENIEVQFSYHNKTYMITNYHDDTTAAGHTILFKDNNTYYKLDDLKNCNFAKDNIYINDNQIYIHCIGQKGNIIQYTINNLELEKQVWEFNYQNTPNISQLHIVVDKANDKYIYLSSAFKVDNNDKNEPQVKCSLKNNICEYTRPNV